MLFICGKIYTNVHRIAIFVPAIRTLASFPIAFTVIFIHWIRCAVQLPPCISYNRYEITQTWCNYTRVSDSHSDKSHTHTNAVARMPLKHTHTQMILVKHTWCRNKRTTTRSEHKRAWKMALWRETLHIHTRTLLSYLWLIDCSSIRRRTSVFHCTWPIT